MSREVLFAAPPPSVSGRGVGAAPLNGANSTSFAQLRGRITMSRLSCPKAPCFFLKVKCNMLLFLSANADHLSSDWPSLEGVAVSINRVYASYNNV